MARPSYATEAQLRELIRQSGLPENAPPANAFRMFAHAPAVGACAQLSDANAGTRGSSPLR